MNFVMIKIYRIEHSETFKGLYVHVADFAFFRNNPLLKDKFDDLFQDLKGKHPLPNNDSLYLKNRREKGFDHVPYDHNFGFESLKQLKAWIYNNEMVQILIEMNFELLEIEIEEKFVILGNTQLSFESDKGKVLNKINLESLKN